MQVNKREKGGIALKAPLLETWGAGGERMGAKTHS